MLRPQIPLKTPLPLNTFCVKKLIAHHYFHHVFSAITHTNSILHFASLQTLLYDKQLNF